MDKLEKSEYVKRPEAHVGELGEGCIVFFANNFHLLPTLFRQTPLFFAKKEYFEL